MVNKQVEGQRFPFNPNFFHNQFWIEFDAAPIRKERILVTPRIFFDDDFKRNVLRCAKSVIPSIEGVVFAADFAQEMTLSEAYGRMDGSVFTPAQFIALLFYFIAHDRQKKNANCKILRDDAGNIFYIRARGRTAAVWVDTRLATDWFEGTGVLGFQDILSPLEDDWVLRIGKARIFVA